LTAITRYKLRKLLKYGLVAAMVAWVLTLFSGERMGVEFWAWALLGIWTGILEEFFFGRRFRSLPVPVQFLGKFVLVSLLTIALIAVAFALKSDGFNLMTYEEPYRVRDLFSMGQFYRVVLRVVVVTSIALLVVQLEEHLGRRVFLGFLLGRFDRPKTEERIVLSMDLVGSTAIAERLGDLRYFRLLNYTYSLMTDAVLRNEADILKYVGDEVLFTWPMRLGLREENCFDLFFDIQQRIANHADELQREFGVVPEYRGALHGGRVIVAQVGHIKRVIDHSGDVMNSVSRMLGLAKAMKVDLLVSGELLKRLPSATERFQVGPENLVPVKGRRREVRVHTIERIAR
jgi:adenylate cyclase